MDNLLDGKKGSMLAMEFLTEATNELKENPSAYNKKLDTLIKALIEEKTNTIFIEKSMPLYSVRVNQK